MTTWRPTVPLIVITFAMITSVADTRETVCADEGASGISSEQIRDSAGRVMQGHDYRSLRRRILENSTAPSTSESDGFLQRTLSAMGDSVGDFLEWIFSGLFTPNPGPRGRPTGPSQSPAPDTAGGDFEFSFAKVLLFLALAVLTVVVIWILGVVLKRSDGRRRIDRRGLFDDEDDLSDLSVPPGELASSTYESRAVKMAAEGNFRVAIRELLLGGMSWIERAGMIRFRKGLTNRDYIRAVWLEEQRRFAYGTTALQFERIYFGRREATQEMFDTCLQAFQGAFREEPTTSTV